MYIKVRVHAGAKKERVECVGKDTWDISVKEKAERNMANVRIREIIAGEFEISPKEVRIISGHHNPSKILSIPDT